MRAFVLVVLVASAAHPGAAAQERREPGKPQWSVLRLKIQKTDEYATIYDGSGLTCALRLPERLIVGIDAAKSTVTMTDDTKLELIQPNTTLSPIREPALSEHGKYASILCQGRNLPAQGATTIRLKGTIAVMVGSNEKSIEIKEPTLGMPIELPIGKLSPVSGSAKRPGEQFSYSGSRPMKDFLLIDGAGEEATYRLISRFKSFGSDRQDFYTFLSATKSGKKTARSIRVTYFETVEAIMVPVDLTVSIGF